MVPPMKILIPIALLALTSCRGDRSPGLPEPAFDRGTALLDAAPELDSTVPDLDVGNLPPDQGHQRDGGPQPDLGSEPDARPLEPGGRITIATYNVFNLFDAIDDPNHNEGEFTPGRWTQNLLNRRLQRLAEAIKATDADIISLIEVENMGVLEQLRDVVTAANGPDYQFLAITEGRDYRGIDVAVMSRYPIVERIARPINRRYECDGGEGPQILDGRRPEARPILQVGVDINEDGASDLVLLANHWRAKTSDTTPCFDEAHRIRAALQTRDLIGQLLQAHPTRPVVVLGDLNTHEFEPPLTEALNARLEIDAVTEPTDIYNTWGDLGVIEGRSSNSNSWNNPRNSSYNFRRTWTRLDHILLTRNALPGGSSPLVFAEGSASTVAEDFLLDRNDRPNTWDFGNPQGYSDHLPVRIELHTR